MRNKLLDKVEKVTLCKSVKNSVECVRVFVFCGRENLRVTKMDI